MNPCQLTASVTAVANALACKLSEEEIALLATILVQLGDTLATFLAQKAICKPQFSPEKQTILSPSNRGV